MCVYMHVLVLAVFVCVCVCVYLAQSRCRDEGDKSRGAEQPEEEARGVPSLKVVCRCISAVTLSRMIMKKGSPVITPDYGSRYLQLDQTQNRLIISIVLLCVFGTGKGPHGLRVHSGQIRWGGALKPLPVEP